MNKLIVGLLLCLLVLGAVVGFSGEAAEASASPTLFLAAPADAAPLPEISVIEVPGIETGASLAAAVNMHRAAKTWTNGGGNNIWSNGANWGGTVPQSGDTVTFDGTSTANCTVDSIGTFNGTITVAVAYTGTITQSAAVSGVSTIAINGGIWNCAGFSLSTSNAAITVAAAKQLQAGTSGVLNLGTNTLTINGTLTYSGTLTITGTTSIGSGATVTGSATPALTLDGGLSINSGVTSWTSVNVSLTGSTNGATYTDTGAKNSGTWTINKTGTNVVVAASTTMALGATPTSSVGGATFTVTGTLTYSGTWTHTGSLTTSSGSTVTGTGSPALAMVTTGTGGLTLNSTSTWTSVNVNASGTAGFTYTDTGAKNSGTWVVNMSGSVGNFTVAASTTMALGTNPTVATGTAAFNVSGTVTYSGTWSASANITVNSGGTVTGSSTPALNITNGGNLTINATASGWTSVAVTLTGSGGGGTYTDTTAKNTGLWTINVGQNYTVAASTTMALGTNPSVTTTNTLGVNGTLTYAGTLTFAGSLDVKAGGTLTGTSSPAMSITKDLTANATCTITNAITPITLGGAANTILTDTGDKLSGTTYVINKTNTSVTIAASTTCRLGTAPTSTVGTSSVVVNGTLTYAGLWTHTGALTDNSGGTVTGTGSPSLAIDGSLTINATSTAWTSVNVSTFGATNTGTYTDTTAKNTGTWTLVKTAAAGQVIAASTSMNVGSNPTVNFGTGTFTVTGTLVWSGAFNFIGGSLTTNNGSTLNGSSSPTMTLQRTVTINATTTITNPISTINCTGSVAGTQFTDTGNALSASTWVVNKTNNNFVIAAGTTCNFGATPSITCGNATFTVTGTAQWSGAATINALLSVSSTGVLTATSSPSIDITGGITITSGGLVTNTITPITYSGSAFSATLTDTTDRLSGTTSIVNKGANFTIAASTTCRLGATPTSAANLFTVTGTVTFSGLWSHSGALTVSAGAVFTGTSSPLLTINGGLNFSATATLTNAIPTITFAGTSTGFSLTDTGDKLAATTYVLNTTNQGILVAANTIMRLGASPTSVTGTGTITCTGTVNVSGVWNLDGGMLITSGSGSLTGALTDLTFTKRLNLTGALAWPTGVNVTWNVIQSGTLTFSGGGFTFGNFRITGTFVGGSTITIIDSSTFATWRDNDAAVAHTVSFTAGTTQTIGASNGTYMIAGGNSAPVTMQSTSLGNTYTLTVTNAKPVNLRNCVISDFTATANQEWWAGPGCTNGGGNSANIVYKQNPRLRPGF